MKIKYLIAAALLSLPALMQGVPADPRVRVVTNPDGTTMEVRVHGDAFFHFMTDAARTRIIEKDARGYYVDAVRDGKPMAFTRQNVELMRMDAEASNPAFAATRGASGPMRMATLDNEGRSNYPTIGEGNKSLVVLVEFSDVSFTVDNPKEYFTRQLNEPGFSEYGGKGSALDYFKDASNGLYAPKFEVFGPVKVSHEAAYFKDTSSGRMKDLIYESLNALDDEIDYSQYDFDDDGIIDTVFFYYAGYGSADSETQTIWPHQYDYRYFGWSTSLTLRLDGKKMGPYACANELKGYNPTTGGQPWKDGTTPWVDGIGTFVHEYGHVLGLPDLYDVDYNEETVTPGEWDIMDAGPYNGNGCVPPLYSAYEQWVCKWLEFTDAEDGTHYDLKALGNTDSPAAVRIRIPKTSAGDTFYNEYFVIESRDNSKWDSCFPEPGVMVWRINYKKGSWTGNSVNSIAGSNVEILYADGEKYPLHNEGAIYPGSKNELKPSAVYQYWKSPFITSISYDAESKTGSFDYNVVTELPAGAPVLHDSPYADKGTARNFTLEWDPLEGADSYQLTIRRVSTGKCLGLYDEFNVGNVTSQKILSVPVGFWNNEVEAYVRAVKGLPCSDVSNVVKFVPKNLPKGKDDTAVDTIEDADRLISGGVGCIVAPEGAVAYTLAGQQVPMEGLAGGVYIVKFGSKVAKVLVR